MVDLLSFCLDGADAITFFVLSVFFWILGLQLSFESSACISREGWAKEHMYHASMHNRILFPLSFCIRLEQLLFFLVRFPNLGGNSVAFLCIPLISYISHEALSGLVQQCIAYLVFPQ